MIPQNLTNDPFEHQANIRAQRAVDAALQPEVKAKYIHVDLELLAFMGWRSPRLVVVESALRPGTLWSTYEGFPLEITKADGSGTALVPDRGYVAKIAFGSKEAMRAGCAALTDAQILDSVLRYAKLAELSGSKIESDIAADPGRVVTEIRAKLENCDLAYASGRGDHVLEALIHFLKETTSVWASWPDDARDALYRFVAPGNTIICYGDKNNNQLSLGCIGPQEDVRAFVNAKPDLADRVILYSESHGIVHEHVNAQVDVPGGERAEVAIFCIETTLPALRNLASTIHESQATRSSKDSRENDSSFPQSPEP